MGLKVLRLLFCLLVAFAFSFSQSVFSYSQAFAVEQSKEDPSDDDKKTLTQVQAFYFEDFLPTVTTLASSYPLEQPRKLVAGTLALLRLDHVKLILSIKESKDFALLDAHEGGFALKISIPAWRRMKHSCATQQLFHDVVAATLAHHTAYILRFANMANWSKFDRARSAWSYTCTTLVPEMQSAKLMQEPWPESAVKRVCGSLINDFDNNIFAVGWGAIIAKEIDLPVY